MKTYFVTGATGAVGAALIPTLLSDHNTEVRLLIRAKDEANLSHRLDTLMDFWEIPPQDTATRGRITALMGDVSLPRFGLEPPQYEGLSRECTHIVHSAGNVRMNLPLEEARKSAVDSVRHIVELAHGCENRGNLFKVEIVSTIGVGGLMNSVPETWLLRPRAFHNTYEEAKAEAEDIIEEEIKKGLPATVHRPSMVVGDSITGKIIHFQIFYHLCEFLSGRLTLGVVPNLKGYTLDIIPSDYVARAIAWSSTQASSTGKILHLCSGPRQAIYLMDLMKHVKGTFNKSPSAKIVPLWLFKGSLPLISLFVPSKARRAMKALPVFFDYLGHEQAFENHDTKGMLEEIGIPLPQPDAYIRKILAAYPGARLPDN